MSRKEYDNRHLAKLVNPAFTLPEYESEKRILVGGEAIDAIRYAIGAFPIVNVDDWPAESREVYTRTYDRDGSK